MIILFFSRLFYPHIGGVETHVLEVGDRLAKQGHKIILVTEEINSDSLKNWQKVDVSDRKTGKIDEKIASWEIHRIPLGVWGAKESNKKWKIWWWLWQHRDIIQKADIVHCHDVFFWYMPFRFFYRDKSVFTTFHGYETKFPPAIAAVTIRRISAALSWGNICVGDFIQKWYGTKPDFVTYGGVDIEEIEKHWDDKRPVVNSQDKHYKSKKDERSESFLVNKGKIGENKVLIVFVGRLSEDTGILAYDEAIGILNNKNTHNIEFVVVGNGNLEKKLKNVTLLASNEQNIYPYIKNAHLVFASSYLTILQALAAKKFVISFYDNSLKKDYLELTPFVKWIAIEKSPEKIAQKVLDILEEKESMNQTIKEAYLWVSKQTWDTVVNLYLTLWSLKKG